MIIDNKDNISLFEFPTNRRLELLADFLCHNDHILLVGDSGKEFEMDVPELMKLIHDHKELLKILKKKTNDK